MTDIPQDQHQHLLQQDLDAFIDTIVRDIRQRHPELPDDDATLRRKVRVGLGRAKANGLHSDDQLWEYLRIMFEIAPNFDRQPAIRQMLDDTRYTLDERWEQLFEETFDEAWEAADHPDFYNPTYWYEQADDAWRPTLPTREELAYLAAWTYNLRQDPAAAGREPTPGEIAAALERMDQARRNLPEIVATYNAWLRLQSQDPSAPPRQPSAQDIRRELEEFWLRYPDFKRD